MRTFKSGLVAGAVLVIGASDAAFAQSPQVHVMTVHLPDGGVGQIEYTGNTPPRVVFSNAPAAIDPFAPLPAAFGSPFFGPNSPFAAMQRVSAEMDREAAAMFSQVDAMTTRAQSDQPVDVAFGNLPPGSQGYSFVSTLSGNGVCSRSVEITSPGNGAAPKVVTHSSGNCGPAAMGEVNAVNQPGFAAPALPTAQPPMPANRPDLLWTAPPGRIPLPA